MQPPEICVTNDLAAEERRAGGTDDSGTSPLLCCFGYQVHFGLLVYVE